MDAGEGILKDHAFGGIFADQCGYLEINSGVGLAGQCSVIVNNARIVKPAIKLENIKIEIHIGFARPGGDGEGDITCLESIKEGFCSRYQLQLVGTLQANVANNTDGVVRMEYKVVWLDSNGAEIPSVVSTWQPMSAAARNVVGLTATAPAPEAVDFRLYVQGAQGY